MASAQMVMEQDEALDGQLVYVTSLWEVFAQRDTVPVKIPAKQNAIPTMAVRPTTTILAIAGCSRPRAKTM